MAGKVNNFNSINNTFSKSGKK
jgi:hypothetical protein